jgi:hypothetical protein
MSLRRWRLLFSLLAFTGTVSQLPALVAEDRRYHGKLVECLHGGAWVGQRNLGVYTRAQIYKERVFTGTVQSVVEISFTDRRLQILPDEVLLGEVAGELTATMNQACLREKPPDVKAGDKWIFFVRTLYRDAIPHDVVDFDSPVQPVSLAQYDICVLRLHADIDESCIPLMPARRYESYWDCMRMNEVISPVANPFPRSSLFRVPEIKLDLISPPLEFRTHDTSGGNAPAVDRQYPGGYRCPYHDD